PATRPGLETVQTACPCGRRCGCSVCRRPCGCGARAGWNQTSGFGLAASARPTWAGVGGCGDRLLPGLTAELPVLADLGRGEDGGVDGHLVQAARQEALGVACAQPDRGRPRLRLDVVALVKRAVRAVVRAGHAVAVDAHL